MRLYFHRLSCLLSYTLGNVLQFRYISAYIKNMLTGINMWKLSIPLLIYNWHKLKLIDSCILMSQYTFFKIHCLFDRSQIPQATLCTQRKMQLKGNLHSPQKTMICLKCALRVNHPWVSMIILPTISSEDQNYFYYAYAK